MRILYYDGKMICPETIDLKTLIQQSDYIDGLVINTVMSKDEKMVIVTFGNSEAIVQGIENYTYEQTKEGTLILLDDVLKDCYNNNLYKRLLINAYITPPLLNYQSLQEYTNNLSSIVNKYPNIDISVFSVNYPLITFLKPKLTKAKIGVLLSPNNANYIDVDFYIFPPILLTPYILNQQHQKGKEIMVLLQNWSELNQMNVFFTDIENKAKIPRTLIDNISVLTKYPDITYNTIKNI